MAKKTSNAAVLEHIKAGTASEKGYALVDANEITDLVASKQVEVNTEITENGKVAARMAVGNVETPVAATAVTPKFELMSGLNIPDRKRGGGGGATKAEIYPFSTMQVGDSFLVAASEKNPNPAKSFATTVSSATRRFSTVSADKTKANRKGEQVPVLVPTKRFEIRAVKAGDKYSNGFAEPVSGARVFRTV